jgi:hypothetical protein
MKKIIAYTFLLVIFISGIKFLPMLQDGNIVRIVPKADISAWDSQNPFEKRNQIGILKKGEKYIVLDCVLIDKDYLVITVKKGYFGSQYVFEGLYDLERTHQSSWSFQEKAPSC